MTQPPVRPPSGPGEPPNDQRVHVQRVADGLKSFGQLIDDAVNSRTRAVPGAGGPAVEEPGSPAGSASGVTSAASPGTPAPTGGKKKRSGSDGAGVYWLLGLIPVVLACLHLVMVSRGDVETLRSLVENLNVTSLVLATVLPLLTTAMTWWFLAYVLTVLPRKSTRKRSNLLIWAVIVFVIDFFAMSVKYVVINAAIIGLMVGVVSMGYVVGRRRPGTVVGRVVVFVVGHFSKAYAVAIVVAPIIIWLGFLGVWMPQERLEIGRTTLAPVYMLSSDVRWTKYMDADHKVHLVPTAAINRRQMIDRSHSVWNKTFSALLRGTKVSSVPDPVVPPPTVTSVVTSTVQAPPTTVDPPR